jgi:hypothetical protein
MDKAGTGALLIGIILFILGMYAIWVFLPDVIAVVRGLIGIVGLIIGLMLIVFGVLIIKD